MKSTNPKRTGRLLWILPFQLLFFASTAQNSKPTVSGIIKNEDGQTIVSVVIEAQNEENIKLATTLTNEKGLFQFSKLPAGGPYHFIFTHVSYATDTLRGYIVSENTRLALSVTLRPKNQELGQIVVTALGLTKRKNSLGYATQEVKGATLNEARDNNFVNSLSGRVAGVNIISGNGVGSSARITIRGESSLNYQKNQPLIIVDGIPVGNDPVTNNGEDQNADYGSSIGEFNPADIESVNVLKGAAASALYGSRAANGALVITTKSGKGKKGIGVTYTGGYSWEKPLRLPKFQNHYGSGQNGQYSGSDFNSSSTYYPQGTNEDWDESWGPATDGSLIPQFDSPTKNGFRGGDVFLPNRGDIIPTPFIAHPDNMKDYFVTGHTRFNSVALAGSNDISNYRFSYTNNEERGIVPNNNLTRNSFALKTGFKVTNALTIDAAANYTKSLSSSRPDLGYGTGSPMYYFVWLDRNININSLRKYWIPGLEGVQQFSQDYGQHDNPFFYAYQSTSGQNKDQLYGNMKLTYKILDNLSIMGRVGTDYFNDFRPRQMGYSSVNALQGHYQETTLKYQENNYDFLVNYLTQAGKIHFDFSAGGNTMERSRNNRYATAPSMVIPGIYNLNNTNAAVQNSSYDENRRTNSLYGFVNMDYEQKIFLSVTGRNDWSSTLPKSDNSYFYPSVNTSILLNRIFSMSDKIDLFKFRAAYAQAGNDADPYSILTTYNYQQLWNGTPSLSESSTLNNLDLKPEKSATVELGTEIQLFRNRLGLDLTVYHTNSKNQIIGLPAAISSGYDARVINAGEITNKGIEIMLNSVPIRSASGFEWNLSVNFARNIGKVQALANGTDKIVQEAPGEDATIEARVGQRMGALYGPGFLRATTGALKGMPIVGANGLVEVTPTSIYLGNINPDWTMGINNRVSYKGVYVDFLLDINKGGKMVSRFINKATGAGQLIETAGARDKHAAGHVYDIDYYRDGAADMGNGTYQRNLSVFDGSYSKGIYATGPRDFYKKYYDHNSEAQLVDRSFVKLRELKVGYSLPKSLYGHAPIQNISLSLVGRNLALWTKNKQFDPETGASTGNGLVGGFENLSLPTTRSLGVNLNVTF